MNQATTRPGVENTRYLRTLAKRTLARRAAIHRPTVKYVLANINGLAVNRPVLIKR